MKSLNVFHSNRDGTTVTQAVEIELNDDLQFVMTVPEYIVDAFDVAPFVTADSALATGSAYEELADRYSKHRLTMGSPTYLMLEVCTLTSAGGASLGIDLMRVVTHTDVDGVIHAYQIKDDGSIGPLENLTHARLLPDTPEIEAKVQELIDSLVTANQIMQDFLRSADPAVYLMKITNDWAPAVAADSEQKELFIESVQLDNIPDLISHDEDL